MIENPNKRIINFVFVNPFPVRLNEFSNRLRKIFDDRLEDYVTDVETRINSYVEKIKNDEFEEQEDEPVPYPITYTTTPYLTYDITAIGKIALATADDPFFNLPPTHKKYFPELIIYNKEGQIIEVIDESKAGAETQTNSQFEPNCRDSKLKINDDRKASISLLLQKEVQMILLVIKTKDLSEEKDIKPGQFDRAYFRLIDDETNQTIDESLIKDVSLTLPTVEGEGDEEPPAEEADAEDDPDAPPQPKPQNIITMGRIALKNDSWIYERYNYMYKEDSRPDLFTQIGTVEAESRDYFESKEEMIKQEQKLLQESREAAAQAAAAKAAGKGKKKGKGGKAEDKKKKEEKDEDEKEEAAKEEVQGPEIEFMPGFQEAIENVNCTVFGPVTVD